MVRLKPLSTDPSLLRRLHDDPTDGAAWDEFVCRYGPLIHEWCRRWKVQPADAADVTQDVLVKLVRQMGRFRYDPAKSFRAYLKTLTRYTWYELLKKQPDPVENGAEDPSSVNLDDVPARRDLERVLEEEFDQELLGKALALVARRVDPHTWEAFRRMTYEGQSGKEVAHVLGMKVATVYKARSNVFRRIKETIRKLEGPAPDQPPEDTG
jgi:RNA polymerase sigma-70 factor (ECF subfamily)